MLETLFKRSWQTAGISYPRSVTHKNKLFIHFFTNTKRFKKEKMCAVIVVQAVPCHSRWSFLAKLDSYYLLEQNMQKLTSKNKIFTVKQNDFLEKLIKNVRNYKVGGVICQPYLHVTF